MMLGDRYSQHSFSQIPSVNIARSKFDRSYAVKDTMDFDFLTPFFIEEVLPGDTMNLNVKSFCRLTTQIVPVMDNMYLDYSFFFTPNRLVWQNWEKFMGAQDNPGDSIDYLVPTIQNSGASGFAVGTIYDHFGIPTDVQINSGEQINALPFRGYNLIFNDWFRDQNLTSSRLVPLGDGPDANGTYDLVKAAKKHDYFTSALPNAQKGAAVTMPLGTSAPIMSNFTDIQVRATIDPTVNRNMLGQGTTDLLAMSGAPLAGNSNVRFGDNTGLFADLSTAGSATINALRMSMMMQSLLELNMRAGTRYTEILLAHFHVQSPDYRLQRPELLSVGKVNITQHPVTQTSETTTDSAQGNLAAFSTSASLDNSIGFSKSFVEHGYVMGLVRARGDITYQQGLNKLWSRKTKYDFFWPKFQELGEQTISNREIYMQTDQTANAGIFGYQERYAEYRYHPSEIRGQFRSTFAQSLDVWHLAQEFGSLPALNNSFIQSNTPIARVLAVEAPYPALKCDWFFDLKHARPIVSYGVPASLGRF